MPTMEDVSVEASLSEDTKLWMTDGMRARWVILYLKYVDHQYGDEDGVIQTLGYT